LAFFRYPKVFFKENVLILAYYTGPFTNRTPKKTKITTMFKTSSHLLKALGDLDEKI
jgi:hypothetical protein